MHEHPLGPTAIEGGVRKGQMLGVSLDKFYRQLGCGVSLLGFDDHCSAEVHPNHSPTVPDKVCQVSYVISNAAAHIKHLQPTPEFEL